MNKPDMLPKILTWRERIGVSEDFPLHMPTQVESAMVAQIAELEAALAAVSKPENRSSPCQQIT